MIFRKSIGRHLDPDDKTRSRQEKKDLKDINQQIETRRIELELLDNSIREKRQQETELTDSIERLTKRNNLDKAIMEEKSEEYRNLCESMRELLSAMSDNQEFPSITRDLLPRLSPNSVGRPHPDHPIDPIPHDPKHLRDDILSSKSRAAELTRHAQTVRDAMQCIGQLFFWYCNYAIRRRKWSDVTAQLQSFSAVSADLATSLEGHASRMMKRVAEAEGRLGELGPPNEVFFPDVTVTFKKGQK